MWNKQKYHGYKASVDCRTYSSKRDVKVTAPDGEVFTYVFDNPFSNRHNAKKGIRKSIKRQGNNPQATEFEF